MPQRHWQLITAEQKTTNAKRPVTNQALPFTAIATVANMLTKPTTKPRKQKNRTTWATAVLSDKSWGGETGCVNEIKLEHELHNDSPRKIPKKTIPLFTCANLFVALFPQELCCAKPEQMLTALQRTIPRELQKISHCVAVQRIIAPQA